MMVVTSRVKYFHEPLDRTSHVADGGPAAGAGEHTNKRALASF
jgi:hypothetical protein